MENGAESLSTVDRQLRLAVLLSGTGRTLENLLAWRERGELLAELVCVASNRVGVRGLAVAADAGIPQRSFRLSEYGERVERDRAMASWVRGFDCDLVLLAGYLSLLDLGGFASTRILNIHPALLPRYGGEGCWGHHVHEAVLAAGDAESGCSVHLVDAEFDRGRVLAQRSVAVLPDDDADSLAARVFDAECMLYPETINRIASAELAL
jgi:formyltetrahydrofolate-dependent phosphoribosylglycinamide formyltransferase